MHKIYIGIALIAILCQCSVSSNEKDAQDQKSVKNVLFIVVDDLTKTLACYGDPVNKKCRTRGFG